MQGFLLVADMNDSERGCGGKLGPIDGSGQPIEIVSQELVTSSAAMHESVGDDRRVMTDGVPDRVFRALQYQ